MVKAYLQRRDIHDTGLSQIDLVGAADELGRVPLGCWHEETNANGERVMEKIGWLGKLAIARGEDGMDRVYSTMSGTRDLIGQVVAGTIPDNDALIVWATEHAFADMHGGYSLEAFRLVFVPPLPQGSTSNTEPPPPCTCKWCAEERDKEAAEAKAKKSAKAKE